MLQQLQVQQVQEKKYKLTSYKLITMWIDSAYTLNLKPSSIQVMTTLLRFYNDDKKYIYPHQDTIGKLTNLSTSTIKRSISELIEKKLLQKKHTRNGNLYLFTTAFFELLKVSQLPIQRIAQNDTYMEHDKQNLIKEPTTPSVESSKAEAKVEVVSSSISILSDKKLEKDLKQYLLGKKKDIRNINAYFSFYKKNKGAMTELITEYKAYKKKEANKVWYLQEQLKEKEARELASREHKERVEAGITVADMFKDNRDKALMFCRNMKKSHTAKTLIEHFNFTDEELMK